MIEIVPGPKHHMDRSGQAKTGVVNSIEMSMDRKTFMIVPFVNVQTQRSKGYLHVHSFYFSGKKVSSPLGLITCAALLAWPGQTTSRVPQDRNSRPTFLMALIVFEVEIFVIGFGL